MGITREPLPPHARFAFHRRILPAARRSILCRAQLERQFRAELDALPPLPESADGAGRGGGAAGPSGAFGGGGGGYGGGAPPAPAHHQQQPNHHHHQAPRPAAHGAPGGPTIALTGEDDETDDEVAAMDVDPDQFLTEGDPHDDLL